jgi:hypothetical protein
MGLLAPPEEEAPKALENNSGLRVVDAEIEEVEETPAEEDGEEADSA